jgi:hypothetical protein
MIFVLHTWLLINAGRCREVPSPSSYQRKSGDNGAVTTVGASLKVVYEALLQDEWVKVLKGFS